MNEEQMRESAFRDLLEWSKRMNVHRLEARVLEDGRVQVVATRLRVPSMEFDLCFDFDEKSVRIASRPGPLETSTLH